MTAPDHAPAPVTVRDDAGYRRVHRLTPLLRLWTLVLAMLAVGVANLNASALASIGSFLRGDGALTPLLIGLGGFVVLCVAVWGLSHAWWAATGFRLTDDEVSVKRGVFSKQERTARYDRIQAVDVVESVIARIFRVAAVRVETAGGSHSVLEISYLNKLEAEALREEVLRHVRQEKGAAPAEHDSEEAGPPEGELVVNTVPIARTLAGAALHLGTLVSVVTLVVLAALPIGIAAMLPVIVGVAPAVWRVIDQSWRFTARLTADRDSLDVTYGLADRRRQTIPLRRIHGVSVTQPTLWRLTGWWQVKVSVAGYGAEKDTSSGTTTLLPVGTRDDALRLVAAVGPLDRHALETVARPEGHAEADFVSPERARWVSPVDLRQQSVTLLPGVAVCHRGRVRRSVSMIDVSHIQELTYRRGPLQNLLNLCTVRFDLVDGPVAMAGEDLDADQGRALLAALGKRRLPDLSAATTYTRTNEPTDPVDERRPAAE